MYNILKVVFISLFIFNGERSSSPPLQTVMQGQWTMYPMTTQGLQVFNNFQGTHINDTGDGWILIGEADVTVNNKPRKWKLQWMIQYNKSEDYLQWDVGDKTTKRFYHPFSNNDLIIETKNNNKIIIVKLNRSIENFLAKESNVRSITVP